MPSHTVENKKAKIIKASTMLQAKIGRGPLDPKTVQRCQDVIDSNQVDFSPLAKEYLNRLDAVLKKVQDGTLGKQAAIGSITEPVVQLKGHAALFGYELAGTLANIMMGFLESIDSLDSDVIQIVDAHHQTLKSIIHNEMKGDGGPHGEMLKRELMQACRRYHSKKK